MTRKDIFGNIIQGASRSKSGKPKSKSFDPNLLGCEHCPQNHNPLVHKIKGLVRITGRRAMLWAQSPGKSENEARRELVGASGKFVWEELKPYGLTREHFDIQNILRCYPIDEHGKEHEPTKQELNCCSIYNDEALQRNAGKAQVHLIFGKMAGLQLLHKAYRKDNPIFWHEPWNAYVVLADHPAYLLRSGGRKAGWAYYTYRDRMKAVQTILRHPGRNGYVLSQDYGPVTTPREMQALEDEIYREAESGNRVSLDVEDGWIGKDYKTLLMGFGMTKRTDKAYVGRARSVVLFHPEANQKASRIDPLLKSLEKIGTDKAIQKTLQHGSYDEDSIQKALGWRIKGYTFDTQYAAYLWKSHLRTYSLASLVRFFFPEFADYKDMVKPYSGNFAKCPLDTLVPYNCADCDVTKRVELMTEPKISLPLLHIYIHCARVLEKMERRGPYLDKESHAKVESVVKPYLEKLDRQLKQLANDPDFNPGSPPQIAKLLFDTLGLPAMEGRGTGQKILETMANAGEGGEVPRMIILRRQLSKVVSTYLQGYLKSAELHDGQLRTIWWLTGAATGRLRSGKGDEAELEGIINFQNFHGNPLLENLLVSDPNWRLALD